MSTHRNTGACSHTSIRVEASGHHHCLLRLLVVVCGGRGPVPLRGHGLRVVLSVGLVSWRGLGTVGGRGSIGSWKIKCIKIELLLMLIDMIDDECRHVTTIPCWWHVDIQIYLSTRGNKALVYIVTCHMSWQNLANNDISTNDFACRQRLYIKP